MGLAGVRVGGCFWVRNGVDSYQGIIGHGLCSVGHPNEPLRRGRLLRVVAI